jgi:hypothetical protein
LVHGYNGTLAFGESTDTILSINGQWYVSSGGGLQIGTEASPYPAAYKAGIKFIADSNMGYGYYIYGFDSSKRRISVVGAPKTGITNYASGVGTAADPLIVDDYTGWQVGDRLWFSGDAYNTDENMYIVAMATTGTATITDYSGTVAGTVLVTDTAHGLLTGMSVDITGTTDYNGTFTVTVVDANSYYFTDTYTSDQVGTWTATTTGGIVLSATSGGAPAALTNTHYAADWVINATRNVTWKSETPGTTYWYGEHAMTSADVHIFKDVEFEGMGGNTAGRNYFYPNRSQRYCCNFDNCSLVINRPTSSIAVSSFYSSLSARSDCNVTNMTAVCVGNNYYALPMITLVNNAGTFENIYAMGTFYYAITLSGSSNIYKNIEVRNSTKGYTNSTVYGGIYLTGGNNNEFHNLASNANRAHGLVLGAGNDSYFKDCQIGNIYANSSYGDISVGQLGSFSSAIFDTCKFSGGTLLYEIEGQAGPKVNAPGSYYSFHSFDSLTENFKHRWYEPYGTAYKCGVDMEDTTVTPLSQNCLRLDPTNDDIGFVWEFKVIATPDQVVNIFGKLKKNTEATLDSACVKLYLPGSTTADATYELPDDTEWNNWSVSANYTGDSYSWATIKICCKSVTTDAKFYIGDIYNGTNNITNLALWYKGKPSNIMFEQLGDAVANADAVWSTLTSLQTDDGTMGKQAVDTLTAARFAGAVAAS